MLQFVKRDVHLSGQTCVLSQGAQKSISKAVDVASDKSHQRRKYNSYFPEQWARIGKYAVENGAMRAAKHFTAAWGISMNESTARRLKSEYLMKLKQEISERKDQQAEDTTTGVPVVNKTLETKDRGRPLLLGKEFDAYVLEFVNNLRAANGVVNRVVVMDAAEGIVCYRDILKLSSHGGHIEITKSWAKSLLTRMGFVKRKCSTSGKLSIAQFDESKEIFLADVAAEVLFNNIPESLIINWDQTALSIVLTGDWIMEKEGAKIVPVAYGDDKKQSTAVLTIAAAGEYLPP